MKIKTVVGASAAYLCIEEPGRWSMDLQLPGAMGVRAALRKLIAEEEEQIARRQLRVQRMQAARKQLDDDEQLAALAAQVTAARACYE